MRLNLPFWLVCGGELRVFRPIPPLVGREFVNQSQDCRILCLDAYMLSGLDNLGAFEIDEIEWQHSKMNGSVVSLKALSTGISKANRTLKPKAYENTTLADIVRKVAKNLGLKVTGTVANIPIKRVTQYQERDVEFLTRLAHEYHHSFKIVGKTLVFTTMESLEQREPAVSLDLSQVISVQLRDRISIRYLATLNPAFSNEAVASRLERKSKKRLASAFEVRVAAG